MSRHFGQWDAEPEGSDDDLEESQRDGYAEMQAELAEIAADWQKDNHNRTKTFFRAVKATLNVDVSFNAQINTRSSSFRFGLRKVK